MAKKSNSSKKWSIRKLAPIGLWLTGLAVLAAVLLFILKLIIYIGVYVPANQKFINPALWICLGVGLIGPAIFAILDPQRIREFLTGRQARHGSNAVIMLVAFFLILIVINVIVYQNPWQRDLTEGQQNSLAPETLDTLKSLPASVHAIGFFSQYISKSSIQDLFGLLKANSSGKFDYEFVDPESNPALANQYKVTTDGTVVLLMSGRQELITDSSEQALTNALVRLMNPGQRTVYFLSGHGERDIENASDKTYTRARTVLEAKNYTVRSLNLIAQNNIPSDALAIVIAGPTEPISSTEMTLLKNYVDQGGSLLVLEDPDFDTSTTVDPLLDYLSTTWGVTVDNDLVIDPSSSQLVVAVEYQYETHPITDKLQSQNIVTFFPTARSLTIDPNASGVITTPLVETIDRSWGETDFAALQNNQVLFDPNTDFPGPLTLAAAVQKTDSASKSRVVVIGDVDFASDSYFDQYGNSTLFINSVDWVAEQEGMINLTARQPVSRQMRIPTSTTMLLLAITFVIVLPGLIIAGGVTSWLARRSRG